MISDPDYSIWCCAVSLTLDFWITNCLNTGSVSSGGNQTYLGFSNHSYYSKLDWLYTIKNLFCRHHWFLIVYLKNSSWTHRQVQLDAICKWLMLILNNDHNIHWCLYSYIIKQNLNLLLMKMKSLNYQQFLN